MRVLSAALSALFASALWLGAFHVLASQACGAVGGAASGMPSCTVADGHVLSLLEVIRPWNVVAGTIVVAALGYALAQQVVRVLSSLRGGA